MLWENLAEEERQWEKNGGRKKQTEIARNLIILKIKDRVISKATGLDEKEIQKIKNSI